MEAKVTKQTNSLEQRACSALTDTVTAAMLYALINDVTHGIDQNDQQAAAEKDKAMDPTQSPDPHEARQAAENAEFAANRLRTILPRLEQRYADVQQAEQTQAWRDRAAQLEAARDALSTELLEYQKHAQWIADTLARADALDSEIKRHNATSPSGERHIYSVELHARRMTAFSRDTPSITANVQLPSWDSSAMLWPVKRPTLATYFGGAIPGDERRYSVDWWQTAADDNAAKQKLAEQREAEEQQAQLRAKQKYEETLAGRTPAER